MANTDPPTGEKPLEDSYVTGKDVKGDPSQWSQWIAFNDFKQQFGRNPTLSELNQAAPYYLTGDPNIGNNAAGKQAIASYYQSMNQPSAQDIYNQQQQKYQAQAGQHYADVTNQFQSLLGRGATQEELNHFGTLIASGQTDPYELGNYLKQTQEYQTTQDTQFRQGLAGQLNDVNSQFFKQYIQPSVVSQFASQGRDVSGASTGLQFALANAAKEMQTQTSGYLANLSASQYQGNKENARSDYEAQLSQAMGLQNAGVGNALSQQNAMFGNNLNMENYGVQQGYLQNYLNRANRPQGFGQALGGVLGGAAGAGLGGYFDPNHTQGAGIGYGAGSGLGQGLGGLFGGR